MEKTTVLKACDHMAKTNKLKNKVAPPSLAQISVYNRMHGLLKDNQSQAKEHRSG